MRNDEQSADALAQAHAELLEDLQNVADSLADEGSSGLRTRLEATRKHVREHFRLEEQNGSLDDMRKREPRLTRAVDALIDEHRDLERTLDSLVAEAHDRTRLDPAFSERVRKWIEEVRNHESRENLLILDALERDIGAED